MRRIKINRIQNRIKRIEFFKTVRCSIFLPIQFIFLEQDNFFSSGQDRVLQVLPGCEVLGRVPDRRQGVRALGQERGGEEEGGVGQAHVTGRGMPDTRRV